MSQGTETVEPRDVAFSPTAIVDDAGGRSRVYHETATADLDSQHDGRTRRILINRRLVPAADDLLVDTVTYGAGVACPEHYHEGTDHFFYVVEGEGVIEIEGEAYPLSAGTVAWVGEGDRHRLSCGPDQEMRVFEYFSDGDHETVYTDGPACTWRPDDA